MSWQFTVGLRVKGKADRIVVETSSVLLYTQRGIERTLRMILVSNRRSKQSEDAVAR